MHAIIAILNIMIILCLSTIAALTSDHPEPVVFYLAFATLIVHTMRMICEIITTRQRVRGRNKQAEKQHD